MWLHLCWLSRALPEPLQATRADELCLKMPPLDIRLRYFVVVWSKAFTWKECSLLKPNQEVSEASALLSLLLPSLCPCWRGRSFVPHFPEHLSVFLLFSFPYGFSSAVHTTSTFWKLPKLKWVSLTRISFLSLLSGQLLKEKKWKLVSFQPAGRKIWVAADALVACMRVKKCKATLFDAACIWKFSSAAIWIRSSIKTWVLYK